MDNTNSPAAPVYINWGDIPLSPLEQLIADTRRLNAEVQSLIQSGALKDHPFNIPPVSDAGDLGAWAGAIAAQAGARGTLPGTAVTPLIPQETVPASVPGTVPNAPPSAPVVTEKRPRGRPRTFESKYPPGDPRRKAESVARSRARKKLGGEVSFDIARVGLMVEAGAGDHIAGSPLADLWSRIVDLNGMMQNHINSARHAQEKLSQLCAEYEALYPLRKVRK